MRLRPVLFLPITIRPSAHLAICLAQVSFPPGALGRRKMGRRRNIDMGEHYLGTTTQARCASDMVPCTGEGIGTGDIVVGGRPCPVGAVGFMR